MPAIIRSIYTYHVRSNGWNDIGYNFLVDAYGRVFEGRAGGIDQPVIGAHTLGFNTGSVGIAVIGNGAAAPLTAAARDALDEADRVAARRRPRRSARPRDADLGAATTASRRARRPRSASSAAIATRSRPTARAR